MNALIQAIPAIANVLLVCIVFWLIFSIMGVVLFQGRFQKCLDADGNRVSPDIVFNRSMCENPSGWGLTERYNTTFSWENSKINFDSVPAGYLALLQVVGLISALPYIFCLSFCI